MPPEKKNFNNEICELRHSNIDKDINNINENVEEIRGKWQEQHEEIKRMILDLTQKVTTSHENLKNKIVLSEKTTGEKIDALNDFDESLKGNGDPGIWESVRSIKKSIKIMMCIILVILLLTLGGNFRGLTVEGIKERLGIKSKPEITCTARIAKEKTCTIGTCANDTTKKEHPITKTCKSCKTKNITPISVKVKTTKEIIPKIEITKEKLVK